MTKQEILAEISTLEPAALQLAENAKSLKDQIDKLSAAATEIGQKIRSTVALSRSNREKLVEITSRIATLRAQAESITDPEPAVETPSA